MGDFFRQKMALLLGAVAASGAAAVAFAACIPDLDTSTPTTLPPPPTDPCGDGFIDLERGEQCDPGEAGAPGCTSKCMMDCDGGLVDPRTNHCYFAAQGTLLYQDAVTRCTLSNGHLVTFSSDTEFERVSAWGGIATAAFWIGMTTVGTGGYATPIDEPGWTNRCPGCYARSDDAGAFPRIQDAGGNCVAATAAEGPWTTAPCQVQPIRVICEREPLGTTTQFCNGALCMQLKQTLGAKRYIYVSETKTANDAKRFCEQFNKGSLIVLSSREEREQLWAQLEATSAPPQQVWIGLARTDDAGTWQWDDAVLDGDGGRQSPWGNREPLKAGLDRAYLQRSTQAADSQLARNDPPPSEALPFVCQYSSTD